MPSVRIESASTGQVQGFKYLWLKRVTGFDHTKHCARCLIGDYSKTFGTDMGVNTQYGLDYAAGDVLYFCGVSAPFVYRANLHFAGKVNPAAGEVRTALYTGDVLVTDGIERIPFSGLNAQWHFPKYPQAFLTCRNFQFGAQHFYDAD